MAIISEQFQSILKPIIYHHLFVSDSMIPQRRGDLFNVQSTSLYEEFGTGIGGMNPDAFNSYRKTGEKGRLRQQELYTQTYRQEEYPVELAIKKQHIRNDQYGLVTRQLQDARMSADTFKELQAAKLLNNAFSSSQPWSDGKALCITTHPKGPDASTTYSNKGTSALTKDALSEARVEMMRFKDDKGNELGIVGDELWVPPELEDTAIEIVGSQLDPSSANNAVNPQAGRYRVIPWNRLSDTNNWFLTSSAWRQRSANWYNRVTMEMEVVHESTTDIVYEILLEFAWGVDDWRWIYGHEVTGS